jgi:hypothetical protein
MDDAFEWQFQPPAVQKLPIQAATIKMLTLTRIDQLVEVRTTRLIHPAPRST